MPSENASNTTRHREYVAGSSETVTCLTLSADAVGAVGALGAVAAVGAHLLLRNIPGGGVLGHRVCPSSRHLWRKQLPSATARCPAIQTQPHRHENNTRASELLRESRPWLCALAAHQERATLELVLGFAPWP